MIENKGDDLDRAVNWVGCLRLKRHASRQAVSIQSEQPAVGNGGVGTIAVALRALNGLSEPVDHLLRRPAIRNGIRSAFDGHFLPRRLGEHGCGGSHFADNRPNEALAQTAPTIKPREVAIQPISAWHHLIGAR